jgi:hypothetical protein
MTANNATSFQGRERFSAPRPPVTPANRANLFNFCALLLLFGSLSAQAQLFGGLGETGLAVRPMVGFTPENPLFRKEMWTPINLEVENFSQETIGGRLVVAPYSETDPLNRVRIEAPIRFAPRQKKMIRLMTQLPVWTEDVNVYLEPGSRGRALASVGVRQMDEAERLVVVLSEGEVSYGGFAKELMTRANPVHEITVHNLTRSDVLPEAVQGYDTVTLLVWDGLRMDDPTPAQQQALSDYLRLGGTLLLALGDRGERLDQIGYRDLLPSIPRETETLPIVGSLPTIATLSATNEIDSTLAFSDTIHWEAGATADPAVPSATPAALLAALGEFPGEPCLYLDGTPILYRQKVEAGWLLVSRISFSDWLKLGDMGKLFWQDLVQALPQHPPVFAPYLADFNVYLKTSLLGKLPSPWFIGGFLGLYTILVIPVNYMFFRKRKRLELAWLVLPVLAILFSWLAYHIGALQQQSGVVQRDLVVGFQPPGSTKARTQTMTAVYSPRRRVFDVESGAESALPLPLITEDFAFQQSDFELDFVPDAQTGSYSASVEPLLVHHWAANNIALDTVVDLGGTIDARAEQIGKNRYRVEVNNQTPYDLKQVLFTKYSDWGELGGVPSGASVTVEIDEDRLTPFNASQQIYGWNNPYRAQQYYKKSLQEFLDQTGWPIVASLPSQIATDGKRVLDSYAPIGTRRLAVYLLAMIEGSISPVEIDADLFAHESASLLLVPVGIEGTEGGILVGPTDWQLSLTEFDSNQLRFNQSGVNLNFNMNTNLTGDAGQILNPKVPISYSNGPRPATLTFSYRFGDRIGRNPPASLTFEIPELTEDEAAKSGIYGFGYGAPQIVQLDCSLFDHSSQKWIPIGKRFEIEGDACRAFWNSEKQELRVRGSLFSKEREENQGRDIQMRQGQFLLPELSVTFEPEGD